MPERIAASLGGFYRLVRDKYRVDELYEAVFVEGLIKKGGRLLWEIDARVVDLIPNGAAGFAVGLSNVSAWFDRTFVDGAVNGRRKHVPGRVPRHASRPDRAGPRTMR